jgi:hypothetical protein
VREVFTERDASPRAEHPCQFAARRNLSLDQMRTGVP